MPSPARKLANGFGSMKMALDGVDERLGLLEPIVRTIAKDVGVIKKDIHELKTDVKELKTDMKDVKERLSTVETR